MRSGGVVDCLRVGVWDCPHVATSLASDRGSWRLQASCQPTRTRFDVSTGILLEVSNKTGSESSGSCAVKAELLTAFV